MSAPSRKLSSKGYLLGSLLVVVLAVKPVGLTSVNIMISCLLTYVQRRISMSEVPPTLGDWIQHKLDMYEEKPRKGTPKGQPYGIPKHKYHAALLHLAYTRSFNLREIAKQAGVSYSLLAKWRTEDRFNKLIHRASREFSKELMAETICAETGQNLGLFVKEEVSNYSISLVNAISKELHHVFKRHSKNLFNLSDTKVWRKAWDSVRDVNVFAILLGEAGISTWGSKDSRIYFWQQRGEIMSATMDIASLFVEVTLQSCPESYGQQIKGMFDLSARIIKTLMAEVVDLRKELIRKGLDDRIEGAT